MVVDLISFIISIKARYNALGTLLGSVKAVGKIQFIYATIYRFLSLAFFYELIKQLVQIIHCIKSFRQ